MFIPTLEAAHAELRLLQHLFRRMCQDVQVEDAARPHLRLAYFAGWVQDFLEGCLGRPIRAVAPAELDAIWDHTRDALATTTVCEQIGVPVATLRPVVRAIADGTFPDRIFLTWPRICLCDRPAPRNEVAAVTVATVIHYKDGAVSVQPWHLTPDWPRIDQLDDGQVASMIREFSRMLEDDVRVRGLDRLRDEASEPITQAGFDMVMGLCLRPDRELDEAKQRIVRRAARVVQLLCIPRTWQPEVVAELRRRLASDEVEAAPGPRKSRGGFS